VQILRLKRSSLFLPALLACLSILYFSAPIQAQEGKNLLLVWTANEEEDLRGYRIYECDGSGNLDALVDELLVEDIHWKTSSRNLAAFQLTDVPAGDHCWAVTAFDDGMNESGPCPPACISILAGPSPIHMADYYVKGAYGSYPGAEESYDEGVVYTFDGKPGELLLVHRFWDINTDTEVEILLNGNSLGYADTTYLHEPSPLLMTRIPPEYLQASGLNTLHFKWDPSRPSDMWAVAAVEILELIPVPASDFYGNLANVRYGDRTHPNAVGFMFEGRPGSAVVYYQVYDIDREGEVRIFLNGEPLGPVTSVGNNTYKHAGPLLLPDDLVLDQGMNTIVFKNVLNPHRSLVWGVGAVQISY
jgi:hypothetical protein